MQNAIYADDGSLELDVLPSRPILAVQFGALPAQLYAGQTGRAMVELTNRGDVTLSHLRVLCDAPHCLSFDDQAIIGVQASEWSRRS